MVRIPGGLNGYEFWMGNTPWTSNDVEQPHVYCSHDGITWQTPPGVTNPLDIAMSGSYNSDTELVWDGTTLHVMWRRVGDSQQGLRYRSTTDGVNFTPAAHSLTTYELSPCLFWDGTTMHMWTVAMNYRGAGEIYDTSSGRWHHAILYRTAPSLAGPWSTPTVCSIRSGVLSLSVTPVRRDPWHMGVTRHAGVWHLLIGIGEVGWGGGGTYATLASSTDGVAWTVGDRAVLMVEPGTWQASHIYRPSLMVDGGRVRVWYSGRGPQGNLTAYAEMPTSYLLTP